MRHLLSSGPIRLLVALSLALAFASAAGARTEAGPPRLFPQLSLSRTRIAFAHAGDIWLVSRDGGVASQLTSGPEDDSYPSFSPDGSRMAFSRTVGDDADVYVVPVSGGNPARLSFHPAAELVRGWSPDGTEILFTAARALPRQSRLYTVPAAGGPNRELPIPVAWNGVFAPDGRIIYNSRDLLGRYWPAWRGYRGGSTARLAVADLRSGTFASLSSGPGNDRLPVWAGDDLLIASDRADGLYNIYSVDMASGQARQITRFADRGIGALAGAPDGVAVYERDGRLFLLDPSTGVSRPVPISLAADRGEMAERDVAAGDYVDGAVVGPGGEVAVAARGDILMLGRAGGARNLTASSSASDQAPAFSADGRRLAYVSFGAGGDVLVLEPLQDGRSRRTIALPSGRGGYYEPRWSPDDRHLALSDLRGGLWVVDTANGSAHLLDSAVHMNHESFQAAWSPDGRWLAYSRHLPNNNRALFLQNVTGGAKYQLTSGEVDVGSPVFDRAGGRLYFLASGNAAPAEAFGMYPLILRPLTLRRIQAAGLDLSLPPGRLRQALDAAAFAARVGTLRFPARDYGELAILPDGSLLASVRQWPPTPGGASPTLSLVRLVEGSAEPVSVASEVDQFSLSPDGAKLLVRSGDDWTLRSLPEGTDGRAVTLANVRVAIVPADEWRQIYRDAWRAMRDIFYDPAHHGQDVVELEERYARYLPGITRRADLTALLYLALGNVSVSHISLNGGDTGAPPPPRPRSGLLGADFTVEGDRFRFARIYPGAAFAVESEIASPLGQLDPPVGAGDYLLRINGVEVTTDRDIHFYLLGTAGRPTTVTVSRSRDGRAARTVTVVPVATDTALREAAWVEGNRAQVRARSNGTLAYVYIPDFQERGMAAFLRQWTAASDKDGVVIDQRYNPGGYGTDYILDLVGRRPLAWYMFRDARDLPFPVIANAGPRVLLVHDRNGSAADTFPWLFQRAGIGPVVGQQTAGTGIGHIWQMSFTDGGALTLPLRAFYNPDGSWDIENRGVVPDVEAALDPAAMLRGEDSQLNAAIDTALALRARHPTPTPRHPSPLRYPPPTER